MSTISVEFSYDGVVRRVPWYISILEAAKERSHCNRKKTAALIFDIQNYHILSIGYNGVPSGAKHCNEEGCFLVDGHCIGTLHAELNAIANLELIKNTMGMVSLTKPCFQCTKMIVALKINMCIYRDDYEDEVRDKWLQINPGKVSTILSKWEEVT